MDDLLFLTVSITDTVIPVLIAVLSSGFLFGLFKVMPERRSILVQASENAVRVVNEAVATLHKELVEARMEINRLEGELRTGQSDRARLLDELIAVRSKVAKLEAELEIYTRLSGHRLTRISDIMSEERMDKYMGERESKKIEAEVHIKREDKDDDEPR